MTKHLDKLWLCLMLLLFAGQVMAQKAAIKVEAMSPGRLEEMKILNPNGNENVSSGLWSVGVGAKVWLSGWDVSGDTTWKAGSSYLWTIASKPTGSTVVLDSTNKQWTGFRPDLEGTYVIKLTVGAKDTSVSIVAAKYIGVDRNGVALDKLNCATCHSSLAKPEVFAEWKDSGHAKMFESGMNGVNGAGWGANCFRCHTVGYNSNAAAVNDGFDDVASTLGFVDSQWKPWKSGKYDSLLTTNKKLLTLVAGIGCENCHGPKNPLHAGPNTQPKTMNAGVCAQCHNEPWRHNRYAQWEGSGHAEPPWESNFASTGTTTVTDYSLNACVRCHDGGAFMKFTEGEPFDNRRSSGYNIITRNVITCQTCHDPHSTELRTTPASSDTLGSGFNYANEDFGNGKVCTNCHKYRRDNKSYVLTNMSAFWGPHYFGATDIILGQNGHTFGDNLLPELTRSGHMRVENTCVGCHMAATPDTGSVARDKIGMHSWRIKWTAPNGTVYENLESCKSCHVDIEKEKKAFLDKVDGMKKKIAMNLPPYGSETIDRNMIQADKNSSTLKKVFWNYLYLQNEGSGGIHNPRYTVYLLQKSLQALGLPTEVEPLAGEVPLTFELAQNYPNPFNPSTEIRFAIPTNTHVRLEIFDVLGRVVATLVDNDLSPGTHQVVWNGRTGSGEAVSSGIYIYRVIAGDFVSTKKMVLLK